MILSAESIKELLNGCACTKLRNFVTVAFLLLGYVILQTLFHHPTTNRVVSASRVNTKTKAAIGRQTRIKTLRVPTVCANESCRKKFDEQINIRENIFPIPKIRHILWRSELVPKYFSTHLKSWERVHPNWSYVLWRDRDLEPFVAANYPKLLGQFRSLKQQIMRVDMIRYMLLLKFGGTYADLDYSLARSLDEFRRFSSVVTREPETHSLDFFGPNWPIRPVANPAFLMSAPGHKFIRFVLDKLALMQPNWDILGFAGPIGLTRILEQYAAKQPQTNDSMETVYVPPSFSFYPYENNSLSGVSKEFRKHRLFQMGERCKRLAHSSEPRMRLLRKVKNLVQLCSDLTNYNPVTDSSPPVYAVHDMRKSGTSWDGVRRREYSNLINITQVLKGIRFGANFNMV